MDFFWTHDIRFQSLKPYPFERLNALFSAVTPPAELRPIHLSIGEPKHPTPAFLQPLLQTHFASLSSYPKTQGNLSLRNTLAEWLKQRYRVSIDPNTQVLPVLGSREALFSVTQALVNTNHGSEKPAILLPNPFYQIYEGAALLAQAEPIYLKRDASTQWLNDWASIDVATWKRTQLVFVCSPDNPTGTVIPLEQWKELFELSDRYGFVIISDECYSEIYCDEAKPPLGAFDAARQLGRDNFDRLLVFGSLSKRSNLPGLRSGFVAGDAQLIRRILQYRTYHGSAMSPLVSALSEAAWQDEAHVQENRRLYRLKFENAVTQLAPKLTLSIPDASFYLWLPVSDQDDINWAQRVWAEQHVAVLPGQFLSRENKGHCPGKGYVRLALVDDLDTTAEAIQRLVNYF